jgi:uncharacterized protein with HEPN domain
MARDVRAYLWDAAAELGRALHFVEASDRQRYLDDDLLRAAVERKLQNAGEALAQLRKADPALAERVPDHAHVVGFRNVLVHQYQAIDDNRVWNLLSDEAPAMLSALNALLSELDREDEGKGQT